MTPLLANHTPLGICQSTLQGDGRNRFLLLRVIRLCFTPTGLVELSENGSADSAEHMFGYARLEQFLKEHRHLSIRDLVDALYKAALTYAQRSQFEDDLTLLGFEVVEP